MTDKEKVLAVYPMARCKRRKERRFSGVQNRRIGSFVFSVCITNNEQTEWFTTSKEAWSNALKNIEKQKQ